MVEGVTGAALDVAGGILGGMFPEVSGKALAIIGAGIAVGAAGMASAIGAGIVGATGAKAVAEDPKKFSTALLFQALPQTQGIYGFLIAILILLGAGVIGTVKDMSVAQGLGRTRCRSRSWSRRSKRNWSRSRSSSWSRRSE